MRDPMANWKKMGQKHEMIVLNCVKFKHKFMLVFHISQYLNNLYFIVYQWFVLVWQYTYYIILIHSCAHNLETNLIILLDHNVLKGKKTFKLLKLTLQDYLLIYNLSKLTPTLSAMHRPARPYLINCFIARWIWVGVKLHFRRNWLQKEKL